VESLLAQSDSADVMDRPAWTWQSASWPRSQSVSAYLREPA
jgi:hypothetical protein